MHSKLWWAELRHFVIQAFCWFDWFVSIDALHSTWQSIWCVAHVWTNLDRCAVIRLCRISWWAGTQYAPNLLWWLQMPWCETGTKLKRKCPYLDDKMNTLFPISRLPIIPRSHKRIFLTIPYGSPNRSQSQASVNNTLRSVYNSSQLGDIRNEPWKQRQTFWHVKNFLRLPTDWFFRKSFGNNT